jgi:hypothetical protein
VPLQHLPRHPSSSAATATAAASSEELHVAAAAAAAAALVRWLGFSSASAAKPPSLPFHP